jgi:hypothetical protein
MQPTLRSPNDLSKYNKQIRPVRLTRIPPAHPSQLAHAAAQSVPGIQLPVTTGEPIMPSQTQPQAQPTDKIRSSPDTCETKIDRNAPAGSKNSLGAKSDCNGRPTTDDSVTEAKDEQPLETPPTAEKSRP